ncbi:MAG: hypothetical protein Q7S11_03405 [bacterium]|nr:hypothetical protein [bacterium]
MKLKRDEKGFFIIMFLLAIDFFLVFFVNHIPTQGGKDFNFSEISPSLIYTTVSSVYLFNIIFLKTIKNVQLLKWFLYAGILIFIHKNLFVVYTYLTLSPEKGVIWGVLFANVVFMLFLYANYLYVFRLKNIKMENGDNSLIITKRLP